MFLSEANPKCWALISTLMVMSVWQSSALLPYPPTMIKQPGFEQLFELNEDKENRPLSIECEANANPEPRYRWTKNGEDFAPFKRSIIRQPRRGTLVFLKAEAEDEGLYQCFAENIYGTSVSNAVFLRKAELGSFPDEEPEVIRVIEGNPVTFECNPPTGYPNPVIVWVIQNKSGAIRSINSSRITVDPEGDLHFAYVEPDDALHDAMYVCTASSPIVGQFRLGRRTLLKVETSDLGLGRHPPLAQYVSPSSIAVLRGKKLELNCIFSGSPLPSIVWKKDGDVLQGDRYTYRNYGKTLQIRKVDYQDEGTYECTASNGQGEPQTRSMSVTVLSAPFWIKTPNNTNAAEEDSVRFECIASGTPEPNLQWFVNGVPFEKTPSNPRRKLDGNALIIQNLRKTDTAVYQCNASNVHGYAFKNFYLNVLALPPEYVEAPEPTVHAVVRSTAILRCRVFGVPKPKVQWMKDRTELTGGRYEILDDGDLKIRDVTIMDQGDYGCYASNQFGDISAHVTLQVKDAPNPPQIINVECDGFTALVEWKPVNSVLEYTLQYNTTFTPEIWEDGSAPIPASDTRFKFIMSPWTNYTFRITARDKIGQSVPSGVSKMCTSPEDVPYKNPDKVNGRGTTPTNLVISWKVMPELEHNAPGFYYKVFWKRDDLPENWQSVNIYDWHTNQHVIDGLNSFQPHRIKVEAHNSRGQANVNAVEVVGYSGKNDVPNPPEIINVECDGFTALVEWKSVNSFLEYTLQYNTTFTPDVWEDGSAPIPANDTQFKFLMSPWANYTFRITARNKISQNVRSGISKMCMSHEDVPYKNPEEVNAKGTTPTNLVISWKVMPQLEHNAPGFYYKVFWRRDDLPENWQSVNIYDWQTIQHVIDGLDSFKPYRIKVEAHNSRGQANVTAVEVVGYSGENVPERAPKNFQCLSVEDARSAVFSWDPVDPKSVQGHLRGYKIQTWTEEEGRDRLREIVVEANVSQALINIFKPNSRNFARILAFNDVYNGPASNIVDFVTPEGTPGPIVAIDWIPLASTEVTLTWKKPLEPNSILTGYKIYYQKVNGTKLGPMMERKPPITDPRCTRARLTGLKRAKKYRLTVWPTTCKGPGNSCYTEGSNLQDERCEIGKPKAEKQVTWVLTVKGEPANHFEAQYRKKGDSQWKSVLMQESQHTIKDLRLGTVYEVRVIGVED